MRKFYLSNIIQDLKPKYQDMFKEGRTIHFEMPPFCSGDYTARIYRDNMGLYIKNSENWFKGARDFAVK